MITRKGSDLFAGIYLDSGATNPPYDQWNSIMDTLSLLSRHAVTHRKLAEYACNGDPIRNMYGRMDAATIGRIAAEREEAAEKRLERLENRIKELAATLPHVALEMQGDPRGSTVKLVSNGRTFCLN